MFRLGQDFKIGENQKVSELTREQQRINECRSSHTEDFYIVLDLKNNVINASNISGFKMTTTINYFCKRALIHRTKESSHAALYSFWFRQMRLFCPASHPERSNAHDSTTRTLFKTAENSTYAARGRALPTSSSACSIKEHVSFSDVVARRLFSSHLSKPKPSTNVVQRLIMTDEEQRTEAEAFGNVFPMILKDVTENREEPEIEEALKWFSKVVQYNVPHGKQNRGLMVVFSYKVLVGSDNCSDQDLTLARVLGWCVETLQAYFLVADDIMDQSHTRRGKPCWYHMDNIGLMAINDAFFLKNSVFCILRKYFSDSPCYIDMLDLFMECNRKTILGQCLDMLSGTPNKKVNLDRFTLERHAAIVKYKTAFYSFSLPVRLALYLAGHREPHIHAKAESILLKIGEFFQIQDDFLDCFGDPRTTGKIGTDIEDGKCSWLIVNALQLATPEQRELLEDNYAIQDSSCAEKVKNLYHELKLDELYHKYEKDSFEEITQLIEDLSLSDKLPPQIFHSIMQKIYKRKK